MRLLGVVGAAVVLSLVAACNNDGERQAKTAAPPSAAPPRASVAASVSATARATASAAHDPSASAPIAPPPSNEVTEPSRPAVTWRPNGKAFVLVLGKSIAIVPVGGGAPLSLPAQASNVHSVRFSPKGDRLAVVTFDNALRIYDPSSGALVAELPEGTPGEYQMMAFSPDGKLFAATGSQVARIWNVADKTKVCDTEETMVYDLAFTPDQGSIVTTGVGAMARYDAKTCEKKASNTADTGGTFGSWVSADGLHVAAAGGQGHALQLFGGRDFAPIETIAQSLGCKDHVGGRFTRDGKVFLASGGSMWQRSYRIESKKSIAAYDIPKPDEVGFTIPFDDGVRLLVARGDQAELVNMLEKKVVYTMSLAGAQSFDLSWDMNRLVGASADKVMIWDTSSGKVETTIDVPR